MTDQERRLFDAERRYERAMSGVSPYTPPGFGQTPDPHGLGLNRTGGPRPRAATPTEMALAEAEYRWALSAWGARPIPRRSCDFPLLGTQGAWRSPSRKERPDEPPHVPSRLHRHRPALAVPDAQRTLARGRAWRRP